MIVDAFLAGILPQSPQSQTPTQNANGFRTLMERTGESPAREQESTTYAQKQERSDPSQRKNQLKPLNSQPSQKKNEIKAAGSSENISDLAERVADKRYPESDTSSERITKENILQTENELKTKLAEVLDIPIDEIDEILAVLGIQLVELLEPLHLTEFIQAVHKAGSPVELLNVPDIGQTFVDMKTILEQLEEWSAQQDEVNEPQHASIKAETHTEITQPIASNKPDNVEAVIAVETSPIKPEVQTETTRIDVVATAITEPDTNEPRMMSDVQVEEAAQEQTDMPETQVVAAIQHTEAENVGDGAQNGEGAKENAPETGVPVNTEGTVQYTQSITRTATPIRMAATQEVIGQLLERMRADVRGGVSEVRIILKPENLGDVTLRVAMQNGVVTAHFITETQRVKEIIEANFAQLKDALAEQGVEVSALEVEVGMNRQEQQLEEFLREQQRSSGRIRDIIDKIAEEEEEDAELLTESKIDFKA